jgi:hypothetical protein
VLAYIFWHRPLDAAAVDAYERAQVAFHRSLGRTPPVGFHGSAVFRIALLPWPWSAAAARERLPQDDGPGYEDWYLVEDYTALGVLNEAAVGRGHRTAHDAVASRFGAGSGGLYGLVEGNRPPLLAEAAVAVWIARPPGSRQRALGDLLGDGMDPRRASLWRRQLVLGPAPEYCLLAAGIAEAEPPAGISATRLPEGWTATSFAREVIWNG